MSPGREEGRQADREPGRKEGRRLYKARGPDGEVAWVDHDGLWRLQQRQAEELRRQHARRRRLLLLTLAALVAVALVLVFLRLWSGIGLPSAERVVEVPAAPLPAGDEPAATAADPAADSAEAASTTDDGSGPAVTDPSREEAAAAPAAEPADRIAAAVRAWADAWARQDLAAYLGSYAASFQPPGGMSRSSWEGLRRRRVGEPAAIRVEIERLRITKLEEGVFEARFVQRYVSPRYSDVVDKRLVLIEEAGEWRIAAERAAALPGGEVG